MSLTKKISDNIHRFDNQYFYEELVGVYLVELPDKILLVDLPNYSKRLEILLKTYDKPAVSVLTHGACGISDGKIWQQKINLKVYLHEQDKNNEWLRIKPDVIFNDSPKISPQIKIIFTPGHTPGSICLYYKNKKTLFTGDTIGGKSYGKIMDFLGHDDSFYGDLQQRFVSCKKLINLDFTYILPFHYEMITQNAKVQLSKFLGLHSI